MSHNTESIYKASDYRDNLPFSRDRHAKDMVHVLHKTYGAHERKVGSWNAEDRKRQLAQPNFQLPADARHWDEAVRNYEPRPNPLLKALQNAVVEKVDREAFRDQSEDRKLAPYFVGAFSSEEGRFGYAVFKRATGQVWEWPFSKAMDAQLRADAYNEGRA